MPYWNFRAIEVSSIQNIPYDYYDTIGVPATFLKDIHPDQFEIIGLGVGKQQFMALNGFIDRSSYPREKFQKFYIKKGDPENRYNERNSMLFTSLDGKNPYKRPFSRVLIRNKKITKNENGYGFEDVIKWLNQELLSKKPIDIWNHELLYKKRSNQKILKKSKK